MPTYTYECQECKKPFELTMKISEHKKKKVKCPKCNSGKVRQTVSSFQTITSKKS